MAAPSAQNWSVTRTFLKLWSSSEVDANSEGAQRRIAVRRILIMEPCFAVLPRPVKPEPSGQRAVPRQGSSGLLCHAESHNNCIPQRGTIRMASRRHDTRLGGRTILSSRRKTNLFTAVSLRGLTQLSFSLFRKPCSWSGQRATMAASVAIDAVVARARRQEHRPLARARLVLRLVLLRGRRNYWR